MRLTLTDTRTGKPLDAELAVTGAGAGVRPARGRVARRSPGGSTVPDGLSAITYKVVAASDKHLRRRGGR